jgi:hypothetical protein
MRIKRAVGDQMKLVHSLWGEVVETVQRLNFHFYHFSRQHSRHQDYFLRAHKRASLVPLELPVALLTLLHLQQVIPVPAGAQL